ncbi:MAG: class B sortase [Oscillospiraceae bacterium]|nr:class B sortase [Oscillospiraceae bacterium]
MKRLLILLSVFALLGVIGYSGYRLQDINQNTAQEAELHRWLMQFHPMLQASPSDEPAPALLAERAPVPQVNQSILDLQAEFPDAVGWLTIPNTEVDYPFVQGTDNDYYLRRDLHQQRASAGTVFMDYRNNSGFSDFHTLIYGHHMRSGSMFAALQKFDDQAFFEANPTGTIFLTNATYEIEFMAFAVIRPNDAMIYDPLITTAEDKIAFLGYVRDIARHYRDIGTAENDRIVTLSTCNYEFNNARMVLIGRIVQNG